MVVETQPSLSKLPYSRNVLAMYNPTLHTVSAEASAFGSGRTQRGAERQKAAASCIIFSRALTPTEQKYA